MPSVPRREPDQVRLQGLPSARLNTNAPADAFGAGPSAEAFGQSTKDLTRSFGDIILKEKQKADEAVVVGFDGEATKLETDLLYHPEHGALNKQRQDALAAIGPTMEAYYKTTDESIKRLANDSQRATATKLRNERGLSMERKLAVNGAGETRKIHIEAGETNAHNANEGAVASRNTKASPDEPEPVIGYIKQGRNALSLSLENAGVEKDVIERRVKEFTSNSVVNVANAHLRQDNDPAKADAFLKSYGHLLTENDRNSIVPLVREKVFEQRVLSTANESIVKAGVREDGSIKEEEAIAIALDASKDLNDIEQEKVREATSAKVRIFDHQTAERKNTQVQTYFTRAIEGARQKAPPEVLRHSLEPLTAGMSEQERRKMDGFLVSLYTNPQKALDESIESRVESATAWAQVKSHIATKYDKNQTYTDPKTGAELSMRVFVESQIKDATVGAGMKSGKWLGYATEQLKDVAIPPTSWLERKLPSVFGETERQLEKTIRDKEGEDKNFHWSTLPDGKVARLPIIQAKRKDGSTVRVVKLPDGRLEVVPDATKR